MSMPELNPYVTPYSFVRAPIPACSVLMVVVCASLISLICHQTLRYLSHLLSVASGFLVLLCPFCSTLTLSPFLVLSFTTSVVYYFLFIVLLFSLIVPSESDHAALYLPFSFFV